MRLEPDARKPARPVLRGGNDGNVVSLPDLRRQYRLKGETLLGKTIRATMHLRTSRLHGESYYAVEFEVVSDGKYARQIADFRRQHYSPALFRQLSGPVENGNGNGHDNGHGHEANGHAESASQSKKK